jgi:hypothetical protein
MTTATKTPTTDALLAEIGALHTEIRQTTDALPNMLDLPPMTERQRNTEIERRYRLPQHLMVCSTLAEQITKAIATRAVRLPQRDRLLAAKAAIEQQIKDAPDWRDVADSRARDAEYNRQRWLADSLPAIQRGVGIYPNTGQPALPGPLREALTDVCPHCGEAKLKWNGPLPELEEAIAEAEKVIAAGPASLASIRASVAPWLAEAVSS